MSIFSTVPVKKPKMSAFDLSYNNYFTCDMGELIPAFVLPIVPSDRIEYSPTFQVRFAPMLNPVYADIYAKVECFFVPYRLVWDHWKNFITGISQSSQSGPDGVVPSNVPTVNVASSWSGSAPTSSQLDGARLADFLGALGFYRIVKSKSTWSDIDIRYTFNCLPFRAYTLIWNEFYRDEFVDPSFVYGVNGTTGLFDIGSGYPTLDNYGIFRRRWQKDYFTTATPNPQYGAVAAGVDVSVTGSAIGNLSGFFSVAQFRVANSLQKFLERTNIGGGRYNEFILAHFGCMPTDATIQRPEFLGSVTAPVQVMAISQTSGVAEDNSASKGNALGAQAGQMSAVGTKLCFRRSFKEYGVILGLFSVFPKPVYSDGLSRYLMAGVPSFDSTVDPMTGIKSYGSRFDFGFPEFAGVGDQYVLQSELATAAVAETTIAGFGYQQRYAEFKMNFDQVHGDFSLSESGLAQYTFARFFSGYQNLTSNFLECTPRADCFVLRSSDQFSSTVNQCWVQLRNNVRAIRPFPKFSTPTL